MQQNPTCNQYLLNIFTESKLKAALSLKDPAARAKQEKFYTDVKETECIFTRPVLKDGKWAVDITCAGRGWKYQGLRYNTGKLLGLVNAKANYTIEREKLRTQTVTGLYYAVDKDTLHLVVQPQSNIWEALLMTGYRFDPKEFSVHEYPNRDEALLADGHVDIRNTVVAGRIYITHVARHQVVEKVMPDNQEFVEALKSEQPVVAVESVVEETLAPPVKGIQLEPADLPEAVVMEEKPFVDFKALGDGALEAVRETTEEEEIQKLLDEEKPEVVEEKPVQQQQKQKRK